MNPLRRPIAAVGLMALTLTALMAFKGEIELGDAGLRAGIILVAVRGMDTFTAWWLRRAAVAAARVSSRGQIIAPAAAVADD